MIPSGLVVSGSGRLQSRNRLAGRMLGPAVDTDDPHRWVEALRPEHRRAVGEALTAAADLARAHASSTADDLLARADAGVYRAKQDGRNGFVTVLD
jgi:GGDEF domain-containing protein